MGVTVTDKPGDVAATVIPSVGCPMGCNFCSTSAMFGGKGKFVNFYQTGDELFDVMCQLEASMQVQSFFIMDENFLLHRKRALRLLELMEQHDKAWALYVFSSANVLRSYTIEQLVRLGISWVWMGLEGEDSQYTKLHGIDTLDLVRELQSQRHPRARLDASSAWRTTRPRTSTTAIDYAVRHDTDFHQFMLYTPIPGTPLHAELTAQGLMKDESEYESGRHPRPVDLQLSPPAHQGRAGGRAHPPGVRPRLRGQRPEHRADRPDHAGRLASLQEPSRPASPPPLRLGGPRVGDHVRRPGRWRAGSTTATTRRCTPRCRPS